MQKVVGSSPIIRFFAASVAHGATVRGGVGGAQTTDGSGLRGLVNRVEAHGGRLRVESPVGRGTRLVGEIPVLVLEIDDFLDAVRRVGRGGTAIDSDGIAQMEAGSARTIPSRS